MTNNILFGLGGLIIGTIGGILATKHYWKNKYDAMYQENLEFNKKRCCYGICDGDESEIMVEIDGEFVPDDLSNFERLQRKKEMNDSFKNNAKIAYNSMYGDQNEIEEDEEEMDDAQKWYEAHKDDAPEIINELQFNELPEFIEQRNIKLYYFDETLVDEFDDEEITDPDVIFSGCLDDFMENDDELIYVLCGSIATVYVIRKYLEAYYV